MVTDARDAGSGVVVLPVAIRVLADQLTPVLAYRRALDLTENEAERAFLRGRLDALHP